MVCVDRCQIAQISKKKIGVLHFFILFQIVLIDFCSLEAIWILKSIQSIDWLVSLCERRQEGVTLLSLEAIEKLA